MTSPAPPSCCNSRRGRRRHGAAALQAALLAGLLSACSSTPPPPPPGRSEPAPRTAPPRLSLPPSPDTDGPEANPPPDLHLVPDAEPRIEPVRPGGPNKSYAVAGQAYQPLAGDPPLVERGLASWYGRKFHGRPTASGEAYNMYAMTAAHKTMPLPSYARVRNPANGREVVVRVNDRGPFHPGRVVDLSYTAALKLGLLGGVATVEVERITQDAIRSGSWRQPGAAVMAAAEPAPVAAPVLRAGPPPGRSGSRAVDDPLADPIGDLLQRTATQSQPQPPRSAEPLPAETAAPAQAAAKAAPGFWLQLGAFGQAEGALQFQQRMADEAPWLAPLLTVFSEQRLHRLQAGPYASRAEAQAAAQRLREDMQLVPALVERR
jgi:rare lipoprotein A